MKKIAIYLSLSIVLFLLGLITYDYFNKRYLYIKTSNNSQLIRNARIIPMDRDTVLVGQDLLIENGMISQIAPNIEAPGITVFDAKGQYLMPGLIDMHVHLWDRYELGLYLSSGVTTVRSLWGLPMHLRIKNDLKNKNLIGPNFFASGPKLTGPDFMGDDNLQVSIPEEGRKLVQKFHDQGYDLIKTYYGITPKIFEAVISKAAELNMDVAAHPSPKIPYKNHLRPEVKTIEHAEDIYQQALNYQLDTLGLSKVVQQYADYGKGRLVPTLMAFRNIYTMLTEDQLFEAPEVEYMNPSMQLVDIPAQFERWQTEKTNNPGIVDHMQAQHEFHLRAIRELQQSGVTIVAGTDAGIGITIPGKSLHQELALYHEAGLNNYEVLQTATLHAAQTHQMMQNLGSIELGKQADFILVAGNPLEDLEHIKTPEKVWIQGQMLGQEQLKTFDEKAYDRPNLLPSVLRYLEYLLF